MTGFSDGVSLVQHKEGVYGLRSGVKDLFLAFSHLTKAGKSATCTDVNVN